MKKIRRFSLASILAIAVLTVPSVLASAKALAVITIRGAGISGALAMNDPQGLLMLQQYGFFDTTVAATPPQDLGAGYLVTGYLNLDGNSVPFEQGVYYPAIAGEQGYMHYTGAYDASTMKMAKVDRWGVVSPAAGAAFSTMLAAHGVTLQIGTSPRPMQLPESLPLAAALPSSLLLTLFVGAASALIAGGMWALKRRASLQ